MSNVRTLPPSYHNKKMLRFQSPHSFFFTLPFILLEILYTSLIHSHHGTLWGGPIRSLLAIEQINKNALFNYPFIIPSLNPPIRARYLSRRTHLGHGGGGGVWGVCFDVRKACFDTRRRGGGFDVPWLSIYYC